MCRTQVGMRATVTQALRLGQHLFCIVIEIGHNFLSFLPPYICKGRANAKNAPKTLQKRQNPPPVFNKNMPFFQKITLFWLFLKPWRTLKSHLIHFYHFAL
jgi:hypothetical protein